MDIVKRLEIIAETTADDFPNESIEAWMGEAAAEIKKLRAALEGCVPFVQTIVYDYPKTTESPAITALRNAKAALPV